MKIEKKRIAPRIYLLLFASKKYMAHTFLRFQEHYESPEFMGKVFTHKDYFKWYKEMKGSKYHEDWDGFNLPSKALIPFKKGKFDPLTSNEKKFLSLFKGIRGKFYIIAFHGRGHHLLGHEIAHAVYATNESYKKKVNALIKKYSLRHIREELINLGGYHPNVFNDEIQAYAVSLQHELKSEFPKKLSKEINELYAKYAPHLGKLFQKR